jgi:putative salt-induced outer membrane protein YdiY
LTREPSELSKSVEDLTLAIFKFIRKEFSMTRGSLAALICSAAATAILVCAPALAAQDEPELGWFDKAELTFVLTAGNASQSTLGLNNELSHIWENASFKLSLGGIRTENTVTTRTATGTASDFSVGETTDTELSAESYFLRSRYDRNLSENTFLYGGAGWERNTFAGFENRFTVVAGPGRIWFDEDARKLRTDLGVTFTSQDDVVEDRSSPDTFLGARASYDYLRKLTSTTEFGSALVFDQNLDEASDRRADFTNSLSVAMTEGLALKTTLRILYDNSPALGEIPLLPDGGTVLAPLDKTDTIFTVALVISF